MNQRQSLGHSLLVAGAGLLSGVVVGFIGLSLAAEHGAITAIDRTLLFLIGGGCILLGVLPWRVKKPTPGGLAK